ncbi:MAG TPA: tyrosine/phenylalanine carboxypeptidase domain-containing protein [Polyangiaceae bacterium]|nr:tyrosine/phenylalanine carboxypeptidase domain-containing protein [Polyangiaceae bacterium]
MKKAASAARLAEIETLLTGAERAIRLIDRLVPQNAAAERERLLSALRRGRAARAAFVYRTRPDLVVLRRHLDELCTELRDGNSLELLYADRAQELSWDAALVDALGGPDFVSRARVRFDPAALTPGAEVAALVESWLGEDTGVGERALIASDDLAHPQSLINLLRARVGELRLPVRVELRRGLGAVAAAGEDFVVVRPGVWLSVAEGERIALHELSAHVLPRQRALGERLGIFRVGCRGSGEEEEGRAVLIEQRAGYLDALRRRELAWRHLAAQAAHERASLDETVELLRGRGASLEAALDTSIRAQRGGGLGREIVYLPAYLRVRAAFAEQPSLEPFFERGRVSLLACPVLAAVEAHEAGRDSTQS